MRRLFLLVSLLFLAGIPALVVHAQDLIERNGEIISQIDGEAIRGIVPIWGNSLIDGFVSWEINYSYADDTTGTWFLIVESNEPVEDDLLGDWDTTRITDGIYHLRLTIFLEEGRRNHFIVRNLRVRNYTSIETNTPVPTLTETPITVTAQPSQSATASLLPTETPIPETPTPLPTNPLEISDSEVSYSVVRGMAGTLAVFLIIGLYATLRKSLGKA
jgi:hypothetical protein